MKIGKPKTFGGKEKEFRAALARAHEANPNSDFVAALTRFYLKKGYLSDKQMSALAKVEPPGSRRWRDHNGLFDDYEDLDFHDGLGSDPDDFF